MDLTATQTDLKIQSYNLGELGHYRFVVIFARYMNQWLYSRHRERSTWETAGGHIEAGETPLEAAKRELYEETGAIRFTITAAFDYSVHRAKECDSANLSNGQVFLAKIEELGSLPESEMCEVKLFDAIPDKMTYPQILPVIYEKMQGWINLQSNPDELWDIYDINRNLTGRTHKRGIPLPKDDYHLVVFAWIMNHKHELLITKRSPTKGFPGMWECTGGSALAGDDSITAAIREVKEETGLVVSTENGELMIRIPPRDNNAFGDVWLFRQDFDICDVILQENETCDAKWATKDEIRQMLKSGKFCSFHYLEELFKRI